MNTKNTERTQQMEAWAGEFGAAYTARSTFDDLDAFHQLYLDRYGVTRDAIIADWLRDVPRDARVLEVGCNVGNQLAALQRAGFRHLYGIDVQRDAVETSHHQYHGLDTIVGSALDLPFKDGFFDLVFTNNVLIHIAPTDIGRVFHEMARVCSGRIWGFEYFAPEFTEINYRGNSNLLWKADYAALITADHPDFEVEREQLYNCLDEPGLQDKCYLLNRTLQSAGHS